MLHTRIQPHLLASLALAMTTTFFAPAYANPPIQQNDDVLGRWRLTRLLDASNVTALDDKEAGQLIGKIFVVEPDKVTLDGEICDESGFERHYEDTVRYLREEAHASSWKLGLPSNVAVVDLSCTEALIKGYDKIVILWKGVFFDAVRLGPVEHRQKTKR
jgi:hypothetical protein